MAGGDHPHRGLLIDWGGVLTSNLFESFRSFCEIEGLEPDTIAKRFRHDPECRALLIGLETGQLPEEEFEPQFAAVLGVAQAEELIDRLFAGAQPEAEMLEAVRRIRAAGVRTALVSNSWGTRRYDRDLLGELFDTVVISGEVGIRKPAPEIYSMAAERVSLPAEACVFVDDLPFNLEPAAALGMATVHHVHPADTIAQLEALFGLELNLPVVSSPDRSG